MTVSVEELAAVVGSGDRDDPMAILKAQDATRVADLVPVRHSRMSATPFTFYRGAAAVMASDLAATPSTGVMTQLCGDAHLSNFGLFFSPERRMVFDLNDFDETHPGPFEWDVKRLAASFVVAADANGFDEATARKCARAAAKAYRKTMIAAGARTALECWYDRVDTDDVVADIGDRLDTARAERTQRQLQKARHRNSEQALSKLCYVDDAGVHIKSDPPLLVPTHEAWPTVSRDDLAAAFTDGFARYRATLPAHVAVLFDQFRLVETARKVVGVGSVGTRCAIALFAGSGDDPLFLQMKEAPPSVLAAHVPGHEYANQGERVVFGQQLLQASSDIFLGWVSAQFPDSTQVRDFYVRQLRDGKGSVVIEALAPEGMKYYARLCGTVLAQAHARTPARPEIVAYVGDAGKRFDAAIADFAVDYRGLNLTDHERLVDAIARGESSAAEMG